MKKFQKKLLTIFLSTTLSLCAAGFAIGFAGCGEDIKEYTVNFDANGGTVASDNLQTVKQGESVAAPEIPLREGYVFLCWAKDKEGLAPWIFSADTVQSNTTLYAVWSKIYSVTLDANGGKFSNGNESAVQKAEQDALVTVSSEPQRKGYKLTGWAYDAQGKQIWNLYQDKVVSDTTLYAVWAKEYDVVFNANGGSFETAPVGGEYVLDSDVYKYVYAYGDLVTEIPEPEKANYVFKGWYTIDDKIWDFESSTVDGAIVLSARWEEAYSNFEVTYKLNYDGAVDVIKNTENGYAVYDPDPRKGYAFNGWWYGKVENGKVVLTSRYDGSERLESATTLYADWIDETKVIKVLPAPTVTVTDATFTWQAVEGATEYAVEVRYGNNVLNKYSVTATNWTFTSSSKYETGVTYSVCVRAIGNNVNTVTSAWTSRNYTYNKLSAPSVSFDITSNMLTWTSVRNANGYKLYINEKEITSGIINNTYDMSRYEAGPYSVKVETVASSNYQNSQTTVAVVKYKILKPEVLIIMDENKSGYTVTVSETAYADVYVIDINGENYETVKKDEKFTSEKLTFKFPFTDALFKDGSFELKVRAENSNSCYINSDEYTATIGKTVNVTLAAQGVDIQSGDLTFDGNTFNEKLSDIASYTVSFDLNGGNGSISSQTISDGVSLVYPSRNPERNGYVFRGWFTEPECENLFDFTAKINKDVTLYAGWHEMYDFGYSVSEANLGSTSTSSMTIVKGNKYSYMYFVAHKDGTVKFTFSLSAVGTGYNGVIFSVHNATKGSEICNDSWNTYYTSYTRTAEVKAGDVIYVAAMIFQSPYAGAVPYDSLTFYCKATNSEGSGAYDNKPLAGGTIENGFIYSEQKNCNTAENTVMSGQELILHAKVTINGKKFVGWYAGDICISSDAVTTVKPEENITYTAVYEN